MNHTIADMGFDNNDDPSVLYSEVSSQIAYDNTLVRVKDIFAGGGEEAMRGVEALAPYLNASNDLSACSPAQAQVIYTKLSKGYELVSTLHSKAVFDKNTASTNLKSVRGKFYLECFPAYLQAMKAKGVTIKDTDASREHFLNIQQDVIEAKEQVDFFEALSSLLEGWKTKLYSDMTSAKNLVYSKRFADQLSTSAN